MSPTKIVIIGAGSASFGLNTLSALMQSQILRGSNIALVDRNQSALEQITLLAKRMNQEWHANMQITSHNQQLPALEGADFVVNSIEVSPRETLWRSDFEIPLKHGIRQPYAENGGPGGFAHALRNIGPVLEITSDMESVCPKAWLINFTNPMTRICDAVNRYSQIKVVGLCHQILVGYSLVGITLARDLGFYVPPGITGSHADPVERQLRRQVAKQAQQRLAIRAAGINHFTWMLSLHDHQTGEDLYPLFARRWNELSSEFEPLTRLVYNAFGYFPIAGDEHISEYLPWVSDPNTRPWEKYDLSLYDWDTWADLREQDHREVRRLASGQGTLANLLDSDSEGALEVIENITVSGTYEHLAFNLPNRGQISKLPDEAIVETPGVVNEEGVKPIFVGQLPEPIAELCRRELSVVRLCVDAAVLGDRQVALQCLLLDPVIRDLEVAQRILDDYLSTYRMYLPKFWE